MTTARPDREDRLPGALDALARSLEELLVYVRAADGLLRSRAGRVGPTLLGAIESAADAVHEDDRRRVAALGREPTRGEAELGPRLGHLRDLLAEVDRAAIRLRRSNRMPVALASLSFDVEGTRKLLTDALDQRLDQLVPADLRSFLVAAGSGTSA